MVIGKGKIVDLTLLNLGAENSLTGKIRYFNMLGPTVLYTYPSNLSFVETAVKLLCDRTLRPAWCLIQFR